MASKPKIIMKRALRGLYAGRHIQFGNKISEDGGNKTRRCWKPNRQKKRLFSLGLDRRVWLDVTTHALRCIDRAGGLDEYLLKIPERKLHSEKLIYLRKCIAGAYKKFDNSMLPPDLEKKLKLVMEWHLQGKDKEDKKDEEKESEISQDLSVTATEDDHISEMFSRFNIGQEQSGSYPQDRELGRYPRDSELNQKGGFPPETNKQQVPSGPKPRPRPEDFPESLFSNV